MDAILKLSEAHDMLYYYGQTKSNKYSSIKLTEAGLREVDNLKRMLPKKMDISMSRSLSLFRL